MSSLEPSSNRDSMHTSPVGNRGNGSFVDGESEQEEVTQLAGGVEKATSSILNKSSRGTLSVHSAGSEQFVPVTNHSILSSIKLGIQGRGLPKTPQELTNKLLQDPLKWDGRFEKCLKYLSQTGVEETELVDLAKFYLFCNRRLPVEQNDVTKLVMGSFAKSKSSEFEDKLYDIIKAIYPKASDDQLDGLVLRFFNRCGLPTTKEEFDALGQRMVAKAQQKRVGENEDPPTFEGLLKRPMVDKEILNAGQFIESMRHFEGQQDLPEHASWETLLHETEKLLEFSNKYLGYKQSFVSTEEAAVSLSEINAEREKIEVLKTEIEILKNKGKVGRFVYRRRDDAASTREGLITRFNELKNSEISITAKQTDLENRINSSKEMTPDFDGNYRTLRQIDLMKTHSIYSCIEKMVLLNDESLKNEEILKSLTPYIVHEQVNDIQKMIQNYEFCRSPNSRFVSLEAAHSQLWAMESGKKIEDWRKGKT